MTGRALHGRDSTKHKGKGSLRVDMCVTIEEVDVCGTLITAERREVRTQDAAARGPVRDSYPTPHTILYLNILLESYQYQVTLSETRLR